MLQLNLTFATKQMETAYAVQTLKVHFVTAVRLVFTTCQLFIPMAAFPAIVTQKEPSAIQANVICETEHAHASHLSLAGSVISARLAHSI